MIISFKTAYKYLLTEEKKAFFGKNCHTWSEFCALSSISRYFTCPDVIECLKVIKLTYFNHEPSNGGFSKQSACFLYYIKPAIMSVS